MDDIATREGHFHREYREHSVGSELERDQSAARRLHEAAAVRTNAVLIDSSHGTEITVRYEIIRHAIRQEDC